MTASPRKSWLLVWSLGACALVAVVGTRGEARAQAAAAPAPTASVRMRELLKQAQNDYAASDYESARIGLREAISLGERAGLGRDQLMARLYLALGAVLFSGYQEKDRADRAFGAAAQIAPEVDLPEGMATPELQKAVAAARARV